MVSDLPLYCLLHNIHSIMHISDLLFAIKCFVYFEGFVCDGAFEGVV